MRIRHVYNLEYYTPRLWERIVLYFCEVRTNRGDGMIVWYKQFRNRMYILAHAELATWESLSAKIQHARERPENN